MRISPTAFNAATDTYRRRVAHEMVPFDAVPEPAAASDDPEAMLRASRFLGAGCRARGVAAKMPAGVHLATARWVDSGRDRGAHGLSKKYDEKYMIRAMRHLRERLLEFDPD